MMRRRRLSWPLRPAGGGGGLGPLRGLAGAIGGRCDGQARVKIRDRYPWPAVGSGAPAKELERAGWRCERCGKAGRLEVHHVRPLHKGGAAVRPGQPESPLPALPYRNAQAAPERGRAGLGGPGPGFFYWIAVCNIFGYSGRFYKRERDGIL